MGLRFRHGPGQCEGEVVLRRLVDPVVAFHRPADPPCRRERHQSARHRADSQLPPQQRLVRGQRRHDRENDWDSKKFYMPIGVRIGKVLVMEEGTWNFYGEYQTSLIYKDWSGSAVENSFRLNLTYTIPVN